MNCLLIMTFKGTALKSSITALPGIKDEREKVVCAFERERESGLSS